MNILVPSLWINMLSFVVGKYPRKGWLDHIGSVYLILIETPKLSMNS